MAAPRGENVRGMILDAAARLLRGTDFGALSLAQIAAEAGVSKGTLYYYYSSKDDILFDVADRCLNGLLDEFLAWADNPEKNTGLPRLLGFVLERALSGYAIAAFPLAKNTGLAHTFATGADRTAVRRALLVLCALAAAGMAAAGGVTGAAMALAAVLVFLRYRAVAQKQFGGISGDLAGWFLQKAELWMLAALAACSLLSGVTG